MEMAVGVSKHITADMLMGHDIPGFQKHLREALDAVSQKKGDPTPSSSAATQFGLVTTRAQQCIQKRIEHEEQLQQERDKPVLFDVAAKEDSVLPDSTPDDVNNLIPESVLSQEDNIIFNTISPEKLKEDQKSDPTLKAVRDKAEKIDNPYSWKEGILMRTTYQTNGKSLVMVQQVARGKVMQLAHNSMIAGHFGREKTLEAISRRLDRPGIAAAVKNLCESCLVCQKARPAIATRAPLHSLPILKNPFQHLAMDIFGPLKKIQIGNKYILVAMDYTTKWPEAFALKNATTETILDCLIELTARVGIPEEILTDNGTNFMSEVMKQFCQTTGVHQIRTSPYHSQTDGMVERFNSTLKRLLMKLTQNSTVEWDKCLPFVLWAYRGSIYSTTGFSPYQLLFGREMRMPLDELVRYWKGKEKECAVDITEHIQTMQENMEIVREMAQESERKEKGLQKKNYDRKAQSRNFEVGDFVLVFRPRKENKLLNKCQGPFIITQKVMEVTFQVDTGSGSKPIKTFHVNSMRLWMSPASAVFLALEEEGIDDLSTSDQGIETTLSHPQSKQLERLQDEFGDVIQDIPGKTTMVEHMISTGDSLPIRLPPYRLAHTAQETLREEIKTLLEQGIIELSKSPWAAPIVLVPKKDGTTRMCVD